VLGGDEDAGTLDVWPATTEYKLLYPLGNTVRASLLKTNPVIRGSADELPLRFAESSRGQAAWVRLWPLTGRRHQLRLHCAKVLRTPILGDTKYGGSHAADNWEVRPWVKQPYAETITLLIRASRNLAGECPREAAAAGHAEPADAPPPVAPRARGLVRAGQVAGSGGATAGTHAHDGPGARHVGQGVQAVGAGAAGVGGAQ